MNLDMLIFRKGGEIWPMDKNFDFASARNLNLFDEVMDNTKKQLLIEKTIDSITSYPGFHSKEEALLKNAFSNILKKHSQLSVKESELFLTSGSYNTYRILSTYFKNEIVVVPEHIHKSHKDLFRNMGKNVVEASEKNGLFDLDALKIIIETHKTDMAFLYVHHPTAPLLTQAYVDEFADIIDKNNVFVVYDFDVVFTKHIQKADPLLPLRNTTLKKRMIGLYTLSKEFGVPGIRVGFGVAPEDITKELQEYKIKLLDITPHFESELALYLLNEYPLDKATKILQQRMTFLIRLITEAGFVAKVPVHGINLFVEGVDLSDNIKNKLAEQGILVRSGSEYGFDKSVRFVVSQPISVMKTINFQDISNKIVIESEKESDILMSKYEKYLSLKNMSDSQSKIIADKLSKEIRFSNPLAWVIFKNKQKILSNKKELVISEFLEHCHDEKFTCRKRLAFLEKEYRQYNGTDLFGNFSSNSLVKEIIFFPQLLRICNDKKFIEKWQSHEFYEKDGLPCKWDNYILN